MAARGRVRRCGRRAGRRGAGAVYTLQNGDLVIPVVSGTGSLAGLRGTLTVSSGRNHVLNTYRLTRPASVTA